MSDWRDMEEKLVRALEARGFHPFKLDGDGDWQFKPAKWYGGYVRGTPVERVSITQLAKEIAS